MNSTEIAFIILFSLPAYTALICGLYLSRMAYLNENPFDRKPFLLTIVSYFITTLAWFSHILYLTLPEVYITINSFIFLLLLLVYVLSYRFVFEMTKINPAEQFSLFHFLTPLSGFTVMLAWSFLVPRDVQLSLVRSGGVAVEGYALYSLFFESRIPLLLCMNFVYSLLGFRRLARYRKDVVNYSADEYRGGLAWLYQFVFSMLGILAALAVLYVLSKIGPVNVWLFLIPSTFAIVKYIILAHNILLENFVIIKAEPAGDADTGLITNGSLIKGNELQNYINRNARAIRQLETYIQQKKPYLNPKLKITDMTGELNTSRTSLSQLINSVYNVNFCSFINRLRLEELGRIKILPANKDVSEQDLVSKAGFSDYRGYLRIIRREGESK